MTIANDIINQKMPEFDAYLRNGDSLDDIDEYGFTPLIECAITRQTHIAEELLKRRVDVNKSDVTGRTPLHWAADNNDIDMLRLLLNHGADANAYTGNGLSVLVYPLLRRQESIKKLLYHHGAKLDFAQDFINAKLIGHRFELQGDVDIVNAQGQFIELDYEGFILEFTVAVVRDSLRRFLASFSSRHLREQFPLIHTIMDAFVVAAELLQFQHVPRFSTLHLQRIAYLIDYAPMLVFPAASRGHALCFIRYKQWWAKIDRGEHSIQEGSVTIYRITKPKELTADFVHNFLYKKQSRRFFHHLINAQLGLVPVAKLPISSQISGNCSWANVQAVIPVAYVMQQMDNDGNFIQHEALALYEHWIEWDKDRALDECIQRFHLANPQRKASSVAILGGILFQACSHANPAHVARAEKILQVMTLPQYYYVLQSYLDEYCVKRLTRKGNNLLKLLDDCGVHPNINVNPIATGL